MSEPPGSPGGLQCLREAFFVAIGIALIILLGLSGEYLFRQLKHSHFDKKWEILYDW